MIIIFNICNNVVDKPVEKEPLVGNIYAAKKNNETKYYRAEINSKVDNEHFNVCFIDFGSREIVHKNNIIELTETQVKIHFLFF